MERTTGIANLILTGMFVAAGAASAAPKGLDACSETSKLARKACKAEKRDDFFAAAAQCENLADRAARSACLAAARAEQAEGPEECDEIFEARQAFCDAIGEAPYDPPIDPARFLSPAAASANPNPYLPLVPGTVWVYEGGGETVTVTVTPDTKVILGVTCFVVRDVEMENGVPVEDTLDWFAQDVDGNVWYFGELSQEFEDGELVSLEGSWRAGVDGAKPGIVMPAAPAAGQTYRQEFALGDAEDGGEILSTTATESAPGGSCAGTCVQTRDFTPLEPDALEHKFYAPGIGLIVEVKPDTGARVELISVTMP